MKSIVLSIHFDNEFEFNSVLTFLALNGWEPEADRDEQIITVRHDGKAKTATLFAIASDLRTHYA